MSMASEGIAGLLAFFALLLAAFVIAIFSGPSWTGTSSAEAATLAQPEYDSAAPEQVTPEHAPRHAPDHAPAHAQEAIAPLPSPYRAYAPRHVPAQPAIQGTGRPKVTGSPPWGPAPRPPDYLGN